jgi:hypothetical protein
MDDSSYFDSLADDSVVGATVSGNLPGSFKTEYGGREERNCNCSEHNDGTTSWQDKAEVLANWFQQDAPAATATVENAMVDVLSYESPCYEFEDAELYDSAMRVIPYGNAFNSATTKHKEQDQMDRIHSSSTTKIVQRQSHHDRRE